MKDNLELNMVVADLACLQMQQNLATLRSAIALMENPCGLRNELQRLSLRLDNLAEAVRDPSFWRFGPEETEEEA